MSILTINPPLPEMHLDSRQQSHGSTSAGSHVRSVEARAWARALITGELISSEEIVLKTGATAAHVARGLKCLRVPPDLIEHLAEGKAPADLTWGTIRSLEGTLWQVAINNWRAN